MRKITRNILIVSGIVFLSSFTTNEINKSSKLNKISDITFEMIEWIYEDVENDRVPEWTAEMYIENLEKVIEDNRKLLK